MIRFLLIINDKHCTDDSSLLTPSVHIPDGIDDNNDKAQELSSYHCVSGIGEAVDDEAFTTTLSWKREEKALIRYSISFKRV